MADYPIEALVTTPERRDQWDEMARAARMVLESRTFEAAFVNLKRLHALVEPWCEETSTTYRETRDVLYDAVKAHPGRMPAPANGGEQPC